MDSGNENGHIFYTLNTIPDIMGQGQLAAILSRATGTQRCL